MKNKIIKISLLFLVITLTIFGISKMVSYQVTAVQGSRTQVRASVSGGGMLTQGEQDPSSYPYNINTGTWEAIYGFNSFGIAYYPGYQIYCINPGSPLRYAYDIRYAEALELNGKTYQQDCGEASTPNEGDVTPPVYTVEGTYDLPVAAAYIVSDEPIGSWSEEKQRAIWNLRDETIYNGENDEYEVADDDLIIGDADSHASGPSIYDQEAKDYAEYDSLVRNNGLQPTDQTSLDDVYTKVNQETQEYTVGPFNITYTNGIYGNLAFSGISEMKVIGYNSKKQQVRDDIKIEKIILKDTVTGIYGSAQEPQYFEPSADLKVDETEQICPVSGQDFQIVFKDPNSGLSSDDKNRVAYISIKVKFKYMLANGKYTKLRGTKYTVQYNHAHSPHPHTIHSGCHRKSNGKRCHHYKTISCYDCTTTCYLKASPQQWLMAADAIRSIYEEELEIGKDGDILKIGTTMDLGGHVWEDGVATKESKADGVSNTKGDNIDIPLQNVKVTLYTKDGKIAKLLSDPEETNEKLMHRINPTYTDEDGNYLFEGLDSMQKYYVTFEYNGQTYLPTEYLNTEKRQYSTVTQMVNAELYNTGEWKVTSKGTEEPSDREDYDEQFAEIGSYPENYTISNNKDQSINSKYFGKEYTNATYTQKDLMGYTLDRNGEYRQTEDQLIDGYLYDRDGLETTRYSQGIITDKIKEYIDANKKFPDSNAMKEIYKDIAGNDEELWSKLQFIEDCKIESYTQGQGKSLDLYPVYNQFRINHAIGNVEYKTAAEAQNGDYEMKSEVLDGITYRPIYPGQFFVNQGLWKRQEYDAALRKDVYRAVMKINNKTVMYKYDKRTDNDAYWDINVRMSDYGGYYASGYNREVYLDDYEYDHVALGHPGSDLEIYVTYKITIRNQSQSIMTQIKEVVDYYDRDYRYRDDLSWVTYVGGNKNNNVTDDEYYAAMVAENVSKIANARETDASIVRSRYGTSTHSNVTNTYDAVYVKGLEDKKLATGESAYIYLTFQVNKDGNGKVILDDESSPKQNIAEINGYATYYKDGTELPNGISKDSNDIAGLLDRDSNPGNLTQKDIRDNDRYEKNFEDDTDRAKSLRVLIDDDAVRRANGTVWEDERTVKSGDSMIGNGVRDDKENKVAGVTVQLVEKTVDGKEYIWQETTTDKNGYYSFENYIPGDYVIRFYYGNTVNTTKVNNNADYSAGGQNTVSYNGQDFKSTTYQSGITQNGYTDESNRYTAYTNTTTQNESGTYGYNIYAADNNKSNVSDAKDLYDTQSMLEVISASIQRTTEQVTTYPKTTVINEKFPIHGRTAVINYSKQDVTNHIAEVLASPYETPTYNGKKYTQEEMDSLIQDLMQETYMTAETGVIAVEFEYDRQQSDGLKETENNKNNSSNNYVTESNRHNGGYELKDIDLGLTERPKAQLEIDKSIANVKVTLANGSILFDVNKAGDNVIWKDHTEYNVASKKDKNGVYEYNKYYTTTGKERYSYRGEISSLVDKSDKGLIQLTMDEELMHGATIQITYKVKVTNVGEVDYEGQKFYYLGDSSGAEQVTTVANQVVDYVANNLQFNNSNASNSGWNVIKSDDLKENNLVNKNLSNNIAQFNNIIQTEQLKKVMKPGDSIEKTLVLTQLITTENTSDDLTYNNMVEIVKTSNAVGRRMAYSVVGNQDPTASKASEVDSSIAEKVIILPPFGETHILYILGAVVAIILIGGITLIIKKVLKK